MKKKILSLSLLAVLFASSFSIYLFVVAKQHWVARKHIFMDLCQNFTRDHGRPPASADEILDYGDPKFSSAYLSNPVRFPFISRKRTFSELEYPIEVIGQTLVIGKSSGFPGIFSIPEIRISIGGPDWSAGIGDPPDRSTSKPE